MLETLTNYVKKKLPNYVKKKLPNHTNALPVSNNTGTLPYHNLPNNTEQCHSLTNNTEQYQTIPYEPYQIDRAYQTFKTFFRM